MISFINRHTYLWYQPLNEAHYYPGLLGSSYLMVNGLLVREPLMPSRRVFDSGIFD